VPYIPQHDRKVLDPTIKLLQQSVLQFARDGVDVSGRINYIITKLIVTVYGDCFSTTYKQINEAMGILSCVQQEYYRKVAAPYENQKEYDNGSIVSDIPGDEIE